MRLAPRVLAGVIALGALAGPDRPAAAEPHPLFDDGGTLSWHRSLDAAAAAARAQGKLIFVDSGRRACGNCRVLVSRSLPSAATRSRMAAVAVGYADDCGDSDPRVSRIFSERLPDAEILPLVAFLTPDLRWVTGWSGDPSVGTLLSHLAVAERSLAATRACAPPARVTVPPARTAAPAPVARGPVSALPPVRPPPAAPPAAPPVAPREPAAMPGSGSLFGHEPLDGSDADPECEGGQCRLPRPLAAAPPPPPPRPAAPALPPAVTLPSGPLAVAPSAPAPRKPVPDIAPLGRTAPAPAPPSPAPTPPAFRAPRTAAAPPARAVLPPPMLLSKASLLDRARHASSAHNWADLASIGDEASALPRTADVAEALRLADGALAWSARSADEALEDARASRYATALDRLAILRREMTGRAAAVDAERGVAAVHRLEALRATGSRMDDAERRLAFSEFRGSRWEELFRAPSSVTAAWAP